VSKYPKCFNGVGLLEGSYKLKLKDRATTVVLLPRKITVGLIELLKVQLDKLEVAGIIRKVKEPTEWVNSMVMITKSDGSLRICLDPGISILISKGCIISFPPWKKFSVE
jgi:hypothetical protein